jgi:hypothetical protein
MSAIDIYCPIIGTGLRKAPMAERFVYFRLVGIGSLTMPDYYVSLLDRDGHITRLRDLRFETDERAVTAVRTEIPEGVEAEVWQGARRIAVIGVGMRASTK